LKSRILIQVIQYRKISKLLDQIKVGDVLFDTYIGFVRVTRVSEGLTFLGQAYPIEVLVVDADIEEHYTADGRWKTGDKYIRLFRSPKHAAEYFASIKEER